jgi:hypothetical protein
MVERPFGPYNVHALLGGGQLVRPVQVSSQVLKPEGAYTVSLWIKMTADVPETTLIAGLGDPLEENSRFIGLRRGRASFRVGMNSVISSTSQLPITGWHLIAAVFHGNRAYLFVDGKEEAQGAVTLGRVLPQLAVAPVDSPRLQLARECWMHFGGFVAGLTLDPEPLSAAAIRGLAARAPDEILLQFDEASPDWPVQTHGQAGYTHQQDPSLMPMSKAPLGKPSAKPQAPLATSALTATAPGSNQWSIGANWALVAASKVPASPETLSIVGFPDRTWMRATVPGPYLQRWSTVASTPIRTSV